MANQVVNTKIQIRNDPKSNWNSQNPVLLKGEMGIEIDTGKFKIGDGVQTWSSLGYASAQSAILFTRDPATTDSSYDVGVLWINTSTKKAYVLYDNTSNNAQWKQIIHPEDLAALGGGDMTQLQFATNAKSSLGYVDKAISADQLTTSRSITIAGDVSSNSVDFDGTSNITISAVLANIITAGSAPKITFNNKGLVTGIDVLSIADIPNLTMSKITDAGTAATKNIGLISGNVVVVESNGKINESLLPSIAINDVYEAANEADMLALPAEKSDLVVRSDINRSFILKQSPASILGNWVELKTPTDVVLSVNGKTGVITLTTSDITEGSNLYYTETRATASFNANFLNQSSVDLIDGDTILHATDTLILNGGTSSGW